MRSGRTSDALYGFNRCDASVFAGAAQFLRACATYDPATYCSRPKLAISRVCLVCVHYYYGLIKITWIISPTAREAVMCQHAGRKIL